jgi:hypothetical protein
MEYAGGTTLRPLTKRRTKLLYEAQMKMGLTSVEAYVESALNRLEL